MDRTTHTPDELVLKELGARMADLRLSQGLTQAQLATEAGVGKRTVERMEAGSSTQLGNAIRLWRVLGVLERLDLFIPAAPISPMAELKEMRAAKKRSRGPSTPPEAPGAPWQWDKDS